MGTVGKHIKNSLITLAALIFAFVISLLFQYIFEVQEHITTIFVFAVFLVSLFTEGRCYGVVAAFIGTVAVNYAFTFLYFAFNFTIPVNIISGLVMIAVAVLTSALTTQLKQHEADKVAALDAGANDYITKPFGAGELLARVRAALRNSRFCSEEGRLPGGRFVLKDLQIDYDARLVTIQNEPVHLTQTEYNILALLSENCGKMMTYAAMIREIWGGYAQEGSIKKLQVNMANIRRKIGDKPGAQNYIVNELGVGYRLNQ